MSNLFLTHIYIKLQLNNEHPCISSSISLLEEAFEELIRSRSCNYIYFCSSASELPAAHIIIQVPSTVQFSHLITQYGKKIGKVQLFKANVNFSY